MKDRQHICLSLDNAQLLVRALVSWLLPFSSILNCSALIESDRVQNRLALIVTKPLPYIHSVVVPVLNVTPTASMDKLRPNSLTCTLSKVCESFVMKWKMQDMSTSLDTIQFGNHKGRSTTHYLVDLVHFVLSEVELCRYINLLLIDYSNAFDEVDINQSINQTSIAPISPAKPSSVVRQPNQCSTAKSRKQFRNINRPWAVTVSMGERPNQRDVSSDMSWR